MSTITTTLSSLPRPYIGSRHRRDYLNNNVTSLFSSKDSTSESFRPFQSIERNSLSNAKVSNSLQTQQEEQTLAKYHSSRILLDERQLHLEQEQKTKDFIPSTSSPSSLFLSPTTHNITPLSDYNHSLPSFDKDTQRTHHFLEQHKQHPYLQPLNNENKNNPLFIIEKFDQQKPLSKLLHNYNIPDIPEENSLSSSYSSTDTIVETNANNQSHLLTSTPIVSSRALYRPTTNNNTFVSFSSEKNTNSKRLPLISDSLADQSSTISTVGLITDLQHKADACQLNNMSTLSSSTLKHSSNLGPVTSSTTTTTTTIHPYDQRISDQGNKYVIQLKTDEYQENDFTITPRCTLNQLIIDAKHRDEDSSGGYIHRELHKIFNIPKYIDLNQYKYSYNRQMQELTVEMPYLKQSSINNDLLLHNTNDLLNQNRSCKTNILPRTSSQSDYYNDSNDTSGIGTAFNDSKIIRSSNTAVIPTRESLITNTKPFDFDLFHRSAFRPQIVHTTKNDLNEKKIIMSLDLSDYQAEDIKVSIKDRELIVKAERKIETDTRKSRTSFFQSTSLPPQTDIEHLQSNYIDGKLIIDAPYLDQTNIDRRLKTISINNEQETNWQTEAKLQSKLAINDPFPQRTETVVEYVRQLPL